MRAVIPVSSWKSPTMDELEYVLGFMYDGRGYRSRDIAEFLEATREDVEYLIKRMLRLEIIERDSDLGRGMYTITDLGLHQVQENCFAYPIL